MAQTQIRGANNGTGTSQIKAGSISNADIHASAAIALSKLAEAVIQADGGQAFTADQSMGGFKLTNLANGTSSTDAVNLGQLQAQQAGLSWKTSVRVATTTAGTLASSFENGDTVDGVVLATNDRILIKDQAAPAENGVYTVNASGAPTRATDMDAWSEVPAAAVFVEVGTANADTGWVCTSDAGGTLGTTAITFVQFTGAGSITAGTGLSFSGNTLNANAADTSITMNADNFAVNLNTTGGLETSTGVRVKIDSTTDGYATISTGANGTRVVSIKNGNIASDAAIALSKLAAGTSAQIIVADGSGVPTYVAMSGDATIATTGAVTLATNVVREADIVTEEVPSGTINGSNDTFTLANTPTTGTVRVYLNGVRQRSGGSNDYTISGTTITFNAGAIPQTGDTLIVDYFK